jgi:hypothetical protein
VKVDIEEEANFTGRRHNKNGRKNNFQTNYEMLCCVENESE